MFLGKVDHRITLKFVCTHECCEVWRRQRDVGIESGIEMEMMTVLARTWYL